MNVLGSVQKSFGSIRKSFGSREKIIKIAVIGVIVLLVAGALITFLSLRAGKKNVAVQQQTAKVTKGNLSVSITGSAPIASSNRDELTSGVNTDVKKVYFKEGDTVKMGDLLIELNDSDARLNIDNINNSIAQEQMNQDTNVKSQNGLALKAPFSGQVTNIQVKSGDNIGKNGVVLTLTDTSKLKVTLPFSGSGIAGVKVGKKATVNLQDLMQSVEGTVSYVSSKPYSTAAGGELYNVEITIDNPGSLKDGMKANAEIATSSGILASVDSSTLASVNNTVVRSDAGGTVINVKVMENQFVNAGDTLIELQNDDLQLAIDTTDLKIKGLQAQLDSAEKQLAYYKITAPFDGTIISQSVKAGDNVKPGQSMAIVSDMGHMEFSIAIDELDIAKVQVGQRANVTVDALTYTSTQPLTGEVTKIAVEGTSSGGVTTYPVTVKINETDGLKAGMNANAEIFISEKQGVLMVPLEAVQKVGNRSFVWVKGSGKNTGKASAQGIGSGANAKRNRSSANGASGTSGAQGAQVLRKIGAAAGSYYANAVMTPVETGINNDTFIEIVGGLKEGDTVILPQVTTGTGSNTQQNQGFGGGGFGGLMGGGGNNKVVIPAGGGNNKARQAGD